MVVGAGSYLGHPGLSYNPVGDCVDGEEMSTFNLVGFFARKTRHYVDGPVKEHHPEAITLVSGITPEMAAAGGSYWENLADQKAVQFARRTDLETKWMIDWQLVELVPEHNARAA